MQALTAVAWCSFVTLQKAMPPPSPAPAPPPAPDPVVITQEVIREVEVPVEVEVIKEVIVERVVTKEVSFDRRSRSRVRRRLHAFQWRDMQIESAWLRLHQAALINIFTYKHMDDAYANFWDRRARTLRSQWKS